MLIKLQRRQIGGTGLHRQMQFGRRIALPGVFQQGDIGQDQHVSATICRGIHRLLPAGDSAGVSKSVDGDMQFASGLMGQRDGLF